MILRIFKVIGNSMFPTILNSDIVVVSSLPYLFKVPKVNDIVLALNPQKKIWIVKRIVNINEGKYHIAGDNIKESTDSKDFGPINSDKILGKIIFIIPSKK